MTRNSNNNKDPEKKHRHETSVRKLLEGLNMFDGTNHAIISNVDQGR